MFKQTEHYEVLIFYKYQLQFQAYFMTSLSSKGILIYRLQVRSSTRSSVRQAIDWFVWLSPRTVFELQLKHFKSNILKIQGSWIHFIINAERDHGLSCFLFRHFFNYKFIVLINISEVA